MLCSIIDRHNFIICVVMDDLIGNQSTIQNDGTKRHFRLLDHDDASKREKPMMRAKERSLHPGSNWGSFPYKGNALPLRHAGLLFDDDIDGK